MIHFFLLGSSLLCLWAIVAGADTVNVLDYGAVRSACDSSNTDDNTAAFQQALDDANAKQMSNVYAPRGCYRFTGHLSIPRGVTLRGSFTSVPSHPLGMGDPTLDDGTILMPTEGKGQDETSSVPAFITVNANSALQGLVIYHPEQACEQDVPAAYPYVISMVGNNPSVQDVELLNAFNGIQAVGAHRHYIARVQGQPLNIGLFVDSTYDIGRIEDVHFNPWFCQAHPFIEYQLVHGRAFVMGRSDWEYVLNTFAFGYAIGYHFIATDTGAMNGNFVGIGADLAVNASIYVEDLQPFGLLVTNGEFTSWYNDAWLPNGTTVSNHVVVAGSNTGPVKFVNSAFWGPTTSIADVSGSGLASFTSCEFVEWAEQEDTTAPAIQFRAGKLLLSGNNFHQDKNQVELGEGTTAVVSGNIFSGEKHWVDHGAKNIQEVANAFDS